MQRKFWSGLIAGIILSFLVIPQWLSAQPEVSLKTPRQTVRTHIEFLQDEHYHPRKAAKAFPVEDSTKGKDLAIKLKQILDAKGLFVDYTNIPNKTSYKDTVNQEETYTLFNQYPRIYVTQIGKKWQYSRETVEAIPKIHQEVFPFGTDKLVNMVPKAGQKTFLGIALWQYLGLIILAIAGFIVHWIVTWFFNRIIHRILLKALGGEDAKYFEWAVSSLLSWIVVLVLINWLLPLLQLPVNFAHYFFIALRIVIPFLIALIFYRLMDLLGIYMLRAAKKTDNTFDDQIVPIVRKALKGVVILLGFLFILQNLNFNITGILAGLSIGGLALALAAQETLSNIFGSVAIFLDRPFQIGDYVEVNETNIVGIVEEVGFWSTRVRTFDKSIISIPNGQLAKMTIENMQKRFQRRFYTNLAITYDTPPALVETFTDGIKKLIDDHPRTDKQDYYVNLNGLNDYSLNILIWCYFNTNQWGEELNDQEELLLSIMKLAEAIGVRFAFPTNTVHVEDLPGQLAKTPSQPKEEGEYRKKLDAFFANRVQNS